ncbi:hypothetical protein CI109_107242 [Kwoniella shandongensis]|uniref:Uncharacterized protein n=1 Tax=Kwoniella shandongensis TaxID=1734106 RepID=A0A5M6C2D5_9TREE|nr:uncharacterized protein CI109_002525 [Kwoniella shandongensis]KAA5529184.1 hypothetical protein CI109_002525 [Kwoniella shandongensis]
MSNQAIGANGIISPPPTEKASSAAATPPRVVLAGKTGRILCVADIRGDYHELNRLIREHEATAVIHTGDFGFMTSDSLDRMSDKILRHLIQYSPLLPPATRAQLIAIPADQGRQPLINSLNNSSIHFPLSQFPHLLTGAINFPVPVFTVWGLLEDVRVVEKFRTGEYEVNNLSIIDEATTRVVDVGGMKLRLLGLGGTVAPYKMFDNGEGYATIAGGQGTMWTTALQMGELLDTAQRVYDPQETRLFLSTASICRHPLLTLIASSLKADLTISSGLHFRYPVSYNEFSVHPDFESWQQTLTQAQSTFNNIYETVRDKVDSSLNEHQQALLKKLKSAIGTIPTSEDHGMWINTWHWILTDASFGHMLLSITEGRVSAEMKTAGLNFSHRTKSGQAAPTTPLPSSVAAPLAAAARRPIAPEPAQKAAAPTRAPFGPNSGVVPNRGVPTPAGPGSAANSFKNGPNRPLAPHVKAAAASATNTPSATPAASSSTPAASQSSASAKPPTGPRQARGPNLPAGQASSAATSKGKHSENKAAPSAPSSSQDNEKAAPATTKPSTPAANGKPATPTPATNGKAAKDELKAATANGVSTEASSTPTESKDGDKEKPAHSREGSGDIKQKRHSLYIKGIPVPTTEDELKKLFGSHADKISQVKIIVDHISKKQKDFAYVDFATEEEMTDALKAQSGSIRDATVNVSISNPPSRPFADGAFRGRGRGGTFRGRGRGFGSFGGGAKREGGATEGGASEKKEGGGGGGGEKKE